MEDLDDLKWQVFKKNYAAFIEVNSYNNKGTVDNDEHSGAINSNMVSLHVFANLITSIWITFLNTVSMFNLNPF
jgi:hypothetical protein